MPGRRLVPIVAGALLLGTACGGRFGAPEPATTQGSDILDLWRVLFLVGLAVGSVVVALLLWTVVRHRRPRTMPPGEARPGQPPGGALPDQVRANIALEVAYTVVPLVIVVVLFALTLRTQDRVTGQTSRPGLRVEATGFQWGWRFHYPAHEVTALGDSNRPPTLVLPRGTTTRLVLDSPDVIHSFSVPAFLVKKDVVPGAENELDVTPSQVGRFGGYCAEFCGIDHTRMTFAVEVLDPPEFQRWVAEQQQEQRRPRSAEQQGEDPAGEADPGGQAMGVVPRPPREGGR